MSKQCPNCQKILKQIQFRAWVLEVEGSATLDDEGLVESFSPLQSITTVKIGQELSHRSMVTCPLCKHIALYKEYQTIRTCWLTGEAATMEIDFPSVGKKWVAATSGWQQFIELLRHQQQNTLSTIEEVLTCVG